MSISGGKMPDEKGRKLVINGETLAAATTAAIWLLACSVGEGAAGGGPSCERDEPPPVAEAPPTPAPPAPLTLVSLGRLTAAAFAAEVADGESFLAVAVVQLLLVVPPADLREVPGLPEVAAPAAPPPRQQ